MANLSSVAQPQATSALQALSTATILRVPHNAIRTATAKHPALAEALWRDSLVDASILSQWIVNMGRRDATSRIAHLICEVATRLCPNVRADRFKFPFAVTQAQIADATGLTSVHVNRVLKTLRLGKLADVRRQEVDVLNWRDLVLIGDFKSGYLQDDIKPEDRMRILQA